MTDIGRIDAHVHFWKYDPIEYDWIDDRMSVLRRDFLPDDLRKEVDRAEVEGVVAVQARQTVEETRWLLELAEQHPFIVGVVGWADLRAADAKERLAVLAANEKLVGIRHIAQSEPDDRFLVSPDFCRGIACLAELGLAYDLLIYPRQVPAATELVTRFPDQRFVLDHLAKPNIKARELTGWASAIRALAERRNVMCKLSGLVTEADWRTWTPADFVPYLDVVADAFGPERLMLGSDWPVCTVAGDYARVLQAVRQYLERFSADEQNGIKGQNAARFWALRR